jgi:2-polyprenyl-3-methyl-5-hydroxy-6-metoxy-1,4-benzoquinol methylase
MTKVIIKNISISGHRQLVMTEKDIAGFPTLLACPACNSVGKDVDALHLGRADWSHRVRLVVCAECATVYYANPPDEKYIKQYYAASWNRKSENGILKDSSQVLPRLKMAKFMTDAGFDNLDLRIFDFGCGKGGLLLGLKEAGFRDLYGSELAPIRAAKANTYFPGRIFCGSHEELTTDKKFDVIYSNHVLEHTYSPREVIGRLLSKLNEDGILVFFVPDSRFELVVNQTLFLPHLLSMTHRAFQIVGQDLGLHVAFWRGARSDEICAVLERKLDRPNLRTEMFLVSHEGSEIKPDLQIQRIRQMWNLAVKGGGAYFACNSAVHNLSSKKQKEQGYAVISRNQAVALKVGEAMARGLRRIGLNRLSNLMSLIYSKMSTKDNQLVGWRFIHVVAEEDTNAMPVIGLDGNNMCFTVK